MAMDNKPRNRKRRKVCAFCVDKVEQIDYKDTAKLKRYLSERSKILPRRTTGGAYFCAEEMPAFLRGEAHRPLAKCRSDRYNRQERKKE